MCWQWLHENNAIVHQCQLTCAQSTLTPLPPALFLGSNQRGPFHPLQCALPPQGLGRGAFLCLQYPLTSSQITAYSCATCSLLKGSPQMGHRALKPQNMLCHFCSRAEALFSNLLKGALGLKPLSPSLLEFFLLNTTQILWTDVLWLDQGHCIIFLPSPWPNLEI